MVLAILSVKNAHLPVSSVTTDCIKAYLFADSLNSLIPNFTGKKLHLMRIAVVNSHRGTAVFRLTITGMTKTYFPQQAPYLIQVTRKEEPASQEADAAAGGGGGSSSFRTRVGSFNILPRIQSTVDHASALAKAEGDTNRRQQDLKREESNRTPIKPDWRLKDRMKTVGMGLVMALNIGTDPPDIVKPHPCAVLQCWLDPTKTSRSKAKEQIGERLELQYAKWQLSRSVRSLRCRKALDPTVEDVRSLCLQLRRQARSERVLLHYNGHGVPRPTDHGEIWVFAKNLTEYIPLSIVDLSQWLGKPSIVVLDCSSAGTLIPFWVAPEAQHSAPGTPPRAIQEKNEDSAYRWVRETIVLCPCSENEWLPMHPDYPADIFTSCLTTPIPIALRWFVRRNPHSMAGLSPDSVDHIPGTAGDRKTPLGELNWVFTAVTDSIAWNVLPKPLFQRLFREDLMVACMFRNFLLAARILRSLGCTPISHPPLPPEIADHPLWQAWDLTCETMLFQLMREGSIGVDVASPAACESDTESEEGDEVEDQGSPRATADSNVVSSVSSPFFSEQLTAFEVWLDFSAIHKIQLEAGTLDPPEQLPVLLQVLLSQPHRIRALQLLRRFLRLGPWAVNLALSLGIFPYVHKLLQSPEYKSLLVSIWASILSFDSSCRVDLLKDRSYNHFVQHLTYGLHNTSIDVEGAARERTLAAYCLSVACHEYPAGQSECVRIHLHSNCGALLSSYEQGETKDDDAVEHHLPARFRMWLCICVANLIKDNTPMQREAYTAAVHGRLVSRLNDRDTDVRAAACYALGCLIGNPPRGGSRSSSAQELASVPHPQSQQFISPMGASQAIISQHLQPGPPAGLSMPGQFQPSFPSTGQNMQWRPQALDPTQQIRLNTIPVQPNPAFLQPTMGVNRSMSQGHQPMQPQYLMPGPTLQPVHSGSFSTGPAGFLVGGSPLVGQTPLQAPPMMSTPQMPQPEPRRLAPSVFEDKHRLELDISVLEALVKAAHDGSVLVRCEATIGIARAVDKYLDAFVVAAQESAFANANANTLNADEVLLPKGLERKNMARFAAAWKSLRLIQHSEPFPSIAQSASEIVRVVHEHLLQRRMEAQKMPPVDGLSSPSKMLANVLQGIDEDLVAESDLGEDLSEGRAFRSSEGKRSDIRRVASEVISSRGAGSMELNALLHNEMSGSSMYEVNTMNYSLPESEFFEWKKSSFIEMFCAEEEENEVHDLMSPAGAAYAYHERRNTLVKEKASRLAEKYLLLAPKPSKAKKRGIDFILDDDEDETSGVVEEETARKRKELELKENVLFENAGTKMTSMLKFHPFEDYLMACGAADSISLWHTITGRRLLRVDNGNPKGTRMTCSQWINVENSGLFLVGSDDGTCRVWGNFFESNGQFKDQSSVLVSAFHALPMTSGYRGGSGLVCDWQAYNGTLIVGGNSNQLRCWDLSAEKVSSSLDVGTDACITSLTTAWDFELLGNGAGFTGNHCIGQSVIVAGHSDGTLRIFDIRTNRTAKEPDTNTRQRRRPTQYTEHKSWVVNTAFTSYGGQYELISGTFAGEIKAWDLRMSSSIRSLDVQRSQMTALDVHRKIPVLAVGSSAQFVKLLSLDGETIQVLRYHERMASHRLGPISCLAFHPYKPLLAAGATDTFIGVYSPKKQVM